MTGLLATAPLLLVGGAIFLILIGCVEFGYRGRAWLEKHGDAPAEHQNAESFLLSAALGILAILLGFTFSLALDRFETRRNLVTEEAVQLNSVRLYIELMPEPARSESLEDLRTYVLQRVAWSDGRSEGADPNIAQVQARLWRRAGELPRDGVPDFLGPDLRAHLKQAYSIAAQRSAARAEHVPGRVIWVLVLYTALSGVLLGYVLRPTRTHHRTASSVLMLLLTISLMLILDADRPRSGAVQVSQKPIDELGAALESARPPPAAR